jgi:hypothetical protein
MKTKIAKKCLPLSVFSASAVSVASVGVFTNRESRETDYFVVGENTN